MAFNPIGITTDAVWRPWGNSRKAEPAPTLVDACCQSQLVLIRDNIEKFDKKPVNDFFGSADAMKEYNMWKTMFYTIQKAMIGNMTSANDLLSTDITRITLEIGTKNRVWNSIVNTTTIDLVVDCRDVVPTAKISIGKDVSMFDQMKDIFEFEKWGSVCLRGPGGACVKLKEDGPDGNWTREDMKKVIDDYGRQKILEYQKNGILSHLEIRESTRPGKTLSSIFSSSEDEKIELRVFPARVPGYDPVHSWQEERTITIQKSANSNSMFRQIGRYVEYDVWGVVQLTNGINRITLYEEKSTAKHITMTPSPGDRGFQFNEDFMSGMTGKKPGMENFRSGWTDVRKVWLEITKRYISTAEDEDRTADAPLAETLTARFQSITWV